jgi:hypothetical protein
LLRLFNGVGCYIRMQHFQCYYSGGYRERYLRPNDDGNICYHHNIHVNMGDTTKVERIILGQDSLTPGADANEDGVMNMGDVTKIERIILGI